MNKTLRELVLSFSDSEWFVAHKKNIMFELNHCELHHIDTYLFNLYNKGIKGLPNKNNSAIAYLLGITSEEPIRRVSTVGGGFPDIDTDLPKSRRDEVFQMLKDKYGDGFAHLGTLTFSGGKKAFKDSARIHQMSFDKANKISSMMPDIGCPPLKELIEQDKNIRKLYDSDPEVKEVFDDAIELSECLSSLGVHASGVCIADKPLWNYCPMWDSKGVPVLQWEGNKIEEYSSIIKLDILGLKTIDVLDYARNLIKKRYGIDIDYYSLPLDDEKTYQVISSERNYGVFQLEEAGISNFANKCKPKSIHDIAMIVSTWRPGPMNVDSLVERIIGKISGKIPKGEFIFPKYSYIFDNSYNEILYQEGFMQLAKDMCGFSDIKVDDLRRSVGKKDLEKLKSLREDFVNGAINSGEDKIKVERFWEELMEFARYASISLWRTW